MTCIAHVHANADLEPVKLLQEGNTRMTMDLRLLSAQSDSALKTCLVTERALCLPCRAALLM